MKKVEIKDIVKSFGRTKVLDGLTFGADEEEFCVLLGPSGCGKSTILRIIAGLEVQDSGEILIKGREVSTLSPRERNIAMVFQSYALYPHMTVFKNIAFPLTMQKTDKSEIQKKVIEAAKLLNIEELLERKPRQLSGGERQRVALGRAIVRNPELFLFDEPLSNLDARLRSHMRREIIALHKKLHSTMLYVTHDQLEAMTMADKIVLLNNGRIQQIGTPAELYKKPANIFAASFIGTPEINLIEGEIEEEGDKFFFRCGKFSIDITGREEAKTIKGEKITLGIRPESFSPGNGSLKGKIDLLENSGSETIVHIKIEGLGKIITAKSGRDFICPAGSNLSLEVNTREIHFFRDGRRVD